MNRERQSQSCTSKYLGTYRRLRSCYYKLYRKRICPNSVVEYMCIVKQWCHGRVGFLHSRFQACVVYWVRTHHFLSCWCYMVLNSCVVPWHGTDHNHHLCRLSQVAYILHPYWGWQQCKHILKIRVAFVAFEKKESNYLHKSEKSNTKKIKFVDKL